MEVEETLLIIREQLGEAARYLARLRLEMERLEKMGMYPAVPREQWQTRKGRGYYLHMLFRSDGNGSYQGPGGCRILYVGSDPSRIEEARRRVANRKRWEQLHQAAADLDRFLFVEMAELGRVANDCRTWTRHCQVSLWPKDQLGEPPNVNKPSAW